MPPESLTGTLMRVAEKRWGEITIKKQGSKKNQFDKTKSFSIIDSKFNYDIKEIESIVKMAINLTETMDYDKLIKSLIKISVDTNQDRRIGDG